MNTSIALQWSHPTVGGPITKYTIKWGKVYPGPAQATVQYPTNSYVIDNLGMSILSTYIFYQLTFHKEFKTQYMIKIIPVNDVGEGKELLFSKFTGNPDLSNGNH